MAAEEARASASSLANLFSICVECFGLIHGGKDWDKAQHLELTKLGIEQGRLLAWGDIVGICELGDERNVLLDVRDTRDKVEAALRAIIDRPAHTDRVTQFDKFGLKPPKRYVTSEPALDFNRLEAFREKLYYFRERHHDGNPRRGKSATINHWQIVDTAKFGAFVALIRESVDSLVALFDAHQRVDMALKHDIRAFGWHPVFERARAARDLSKLKLVKQVCTEDYPQYVVAADQAIAQLDKEWHDNYDSVMHRRPAQGSEIPGAATRMMAKERRAEEEAKKGPRQSWLSSLRSKGWLKHSKDGSHANSLSPPAADDDTPRSKSMADAEGDAENSAMDGLTHTRSKSISVLPDRTALDFDPKHGVLEEADELHDLSQVPTATSFKFTTNLEPVASMISRNDQYFKEHRKSVV